jgi:hypothetical protein
MDALSELMIGLPGQSVETVQSDLQFMFDRRVFARVYETLVMPNAPMNDPNYRARFGLRIADNGFVLSSNSFTPGEYREMVELAYFYKVLANPHVGLLRYLLYFLQLEHEVPGLTFIRHWLALATTEPETYPESHHLWELLAHRPDPGDGKDSFLVYWSHAEGHRVMRGYWALLQEVVAMAHTLRPVRMNSSLRAILRTQFLLIGGRRDLPVRAMDLPHDVVSYFAQFRGIVNLEQPPDDFQRLSKFPPGKIEIRSTGRIDLEFSDYASPGVRFELESNLAI